jgi:hypothetical protein
MNTIISLFGAWRKLSTSGVAWNIGVFLGLHPRRFARWLGVGVSLTPSYSFMSETSTPLGEFASANATDNFSYNTNWMSAFEGCSHSTVQSFYSNGAILECKMKSMHNSLSLRMTATSLFLMTAFFYKRNK